MPNRIIKESICSSESVNELSWFEEVVFYRLIVNCDDYGCFDARPPILKARLFPLKSVTEKQLSDALYKLATAGIVRLYEYEQKPYLQFSSWAQHQQIRARKHKFPEPDDINGNHLISDDINCNQMISDDYNCSSRARNPIQSESNPNPNPNPNPNTNTNAKKTERAPFVLLSDDEFSSLTEEYGQDATNWMLTKLSNYKQANGKKYKSDAAAIRSWVVSSWMDDKTKGKAASSEPLPEYLKKGAPWPDASK